MGPFSKAQLHGNQGSTAPSIQLVEQNRAPSKNSISNAIYECSDKKKQMVSKSKLLNYVLESQSSKDLPIHNGSHYCFVSLHFQLLATF